MTIELDAIDLPENETEHRSHQLTRCLRLARVCRHFSSQAALADMLRVHERTIRRDMHALCRAGWRVYRSTDNAKAVTQWRVEWPH